MAEQADTALNQSATDEIDVDQIASELSFDPLKDDDDDDNNDNDDDNNNNNEGNKRMKHNSIFTQGAWRRPTVLEFKSVSYQVKDKQILKNMSGFVAPGNMLAIIGSSGAGKTSLLNMLAGRLTSAGNGVSSGEVLVNGKRRDYDTFRTTSAYVLQEDVFFPELTVRETLTFSAMMRLPPSVSHEMKMDRVQQIIEELGLKSVANTIVGNEIVRGVSGGEKKRLSIGTELITDPSLVFLDEPTTGLDSFTAQNIIATILRLAKNGRSVVATIHQPRSSIFQMFDSLLLMSQGQSMYFGPAKDAIGFFAKIGYACPPNFNPSDFFIDLISVDQRTPKREQRTRKRVQALAQHYESHSKKHPFVVTSLTGTDKAAITPAAVGAADVEGAGALVMGTYAVSYATQCYHLFHRAFRSVLREKVNNIAMFSQTVVFALLLGCIWLRTGRMNSSDEVRAVVGALFFILVNTAFSGIFGILFVFPAERSVVWKERASRTYGVSAYFISKVFSEVPRSMLNTLLFFAITYYMIGFRPAFAHFLALWCITLLTLMASEGIAYSVSAGVKDTQQAGAIVPVFVVTSMLFAGFFLGKALIPNWLSWIAYLSFLRYGFALAVQAQFQGITFDFECSPDGGFCPKKGEEVISEYGLDELTWSQNLGGLISFVVALRLLAYFILRRNGPKYDHAI